MSSIPHRSIRALLTCALLGACGGPDDSASGLGGPCSIERSCAEGLSCVSSRRFPEGYCSVTCDDGSCPPSSRCEPQGAPPLCVLDCIQQDECRSGYQCWRGACRPRCEADGDCGLPGARCGSDGACIGPECVTDGDCGPSSDCAGGRCRARIDAGAMLPLGAPCERARDCTSGICLAAALGGVCSRECGDASECFDLGEAACSPVVEGGAVRALCAPLPDGSRPMGAACAVDDECEARVCQEGQCSEVCDDDGDCLTNQVCAPFPRAGSVGEVYSGCGYRSRIGALQVDDVDLGTLELGAGRVTTLELAVPPDTVSITFQARRISGDPLDLTFVTVRDPHGTTVLDVNRILELEDQPLRWIPLDTGELIAALLPNSTPDRLPMVPGLHRWSIAAVPRTSADTGSARVRLRALVKRGPRGSATEGSLDLDIHLAGVGLTAESAPSDARLQGALSRLATILAPAGIRVGDVAYHTVGDSRFAIIDSVTGADSELAQLFRLSADRAGRRLSMFLVRSISASGEGFRALGIAGGIPGPVDEHGTRNSGVVIAFDPAVIGSGTSGADRAGHVMAHEIGHYLGLYHVTERNRPCGPGETEGCAPFGGEDTLADTTRGDTTNLMHWSVVSGGANDRLSAGQGFVLRASALEVP